MAINGQQHALLTSRKRVLVLLAALAAVGITYLALPKSWFEIPDDRPTGSAAPNSLVPSPIPPSDPQAQAKQLETLHEQAAKSPLDFGSRSRYGMALFSAGHGNEALQEFQAAARLAPEAPGVHHNLGIYYLNTGQLKLADAEFTRELEIAPGDGRAHYFRGLIFQAQHKNREAIGQLREAISLSPQLPDAYLTLAMELTRSGDEAQVRTLADSYVRLNGDKAIADYVLSGAYRTWKKYTAAIHYAELTVQAAPDNYGYWHNLGQIYSYAHRWDDADRALNRALTLGPDPTTPLIELGMNAQGAKRYDIAERYFKTALAGSPKTGNVHSYLARLYHVWNKESDEQKELTLYRSWQREDNARRNRVLAPDPKTK